MAFPYPAEASLPMYDFPEVRQATDAWWAGVARHLKREGISDVPGQLLHDQPVRALWGSPHLFLSQCCGFDAVFGYRDSLQVLLRTDWSAPGCRPGEYSSWVVVREENPVTGLAGLVGCVAVINGPESHSGMNALLGLVGPLAIGGHFFRQIRVSGAHYDSLRMLQAGQADVASIDCVTYELVKRHRPATLDGLRILCQTRHAPAHPYVTRANVPPDTSDRLRGGLAEAFADPDLHACRESILLRGALFGDIGDYREIAEGFVFDRRLLAVLAS